MSDGVVRWKIEPLNRSRRGLDERLLLAAPSAARVIGRILARRPAGSRIRRALITRVIRVGFAANNRLDYDAMFVFYEPDVEVRLMGGGTRIDLDPVYWGYEGLRKVNQDWRAGFEQFQFEPSEGIDPGGDRFGLLVDSHSQTSGMVTHQRSGFVFILRDGRAMRVDFYWDWEEAVEALVTAAH
jgi:ketosteroid isomerase-like protein